jgi:microcystin-dependent protein
LITLVPSGTTVPYAGGSAPSGWLLCDGAAVSRTTYAALFATIGTLFGVGNGSTTFNVPDLRGRFPLGKDNMGGTSANRVPTANAVGVVGGSATHTLTIGELPPHAHTQRALVAGGGGIPGNGLKMDGDMTGTVTNVGNPPSTATDGGSGQAHNNMPPYITLNYIIKT